MRGGGVSLSLVSGGGYRECEGPLGVEVEQVLPEWRWRSPSAVSGGGVGVPRAGVEVEVLLRRG